ncbi:hypothetical protein CYMTET_13728 [Cymbomonas tetramitiformis]|uniref:Uncharacterized protein n=1 Tax=Cymbomonas tetramitiformis TaxID=36881 RepID=A0AAE0LAW9_9CHLO|nr:hypothetical protein CYMTET_13728 [Cymbomonas tetramitiformis]
MQNRAAAIAKPVTQQGLARVVRAFEGSADDRGDVTAGLLLQKLGGKLLGMVEKAAETEMLTAGSGGTWRYVGFGVCGKIYREWLEKERYGGNYTPVAQEEAAVVQPMKTKYEAAGLKNVARFDLGGHFGNLYLILKHKDASLWGKRRPVVPGFASPDRVFQNRLGRIRCFLIEETAGHFNVAATQEIVGQLSKFDGGLKEGDVVIYGDRV